MIARWASSKQIVRKPTAIIALLLTCIFVLFITCNKQAPDLLRLPQEWASSLSPSDQHAIVHDEESAEEEEVLEFTQSEIDMFASHAVNNTLIIVPVNTGMLPFAINLVCSLEAIDFDISTLIFWALDEGAEDYLQKKGHTTYRDPSLFYVSEDSNQHGNTDDYSKMMRERPKFFIKVLSSGFDLLMMDVDIVFYQTPLLLIPATSGLEHIDVVYSTDARDFYTDVDPFDDPYRRGSLIPPICNGLFWMKASDETIKLWTQMEKVFEDESPQSVRFQWKGFQDDQRGMDVMLNDGRANLVKPFPSGIKEEDIPRSYVEPTLNMTLLDQTQVVNGHLFIEKRHRYEERLREIRQMGFDRIATHMNWNTGDLTKEQGAKERGLYLLDEWGNCKS